jgi:hypothetical protein
MRLEWRQYGSNPTWKLKRYVYSGNTASEALGMFEWAGKVYIAHDGTWVGIHHRSHEHQFFKSKEEAMVWVEVIVRMEGK